MSGNDLETWPIPISETVREDEAFHCFSLAAAGSSSRLAAADCDALFSSAAAVRHSPEVGQVKKREEVRMEGILYLIDDYSSYQ